MFESSDPTVITQPDGPLIERVDGAGVVPATWCVVICEQGCQQSWAVDTADFDPPLTATDVERLLAPPLLEHEQEHQGVWRPSTVPDHLPDNDESRGHGSVR